MRLPPNVAKGLLWCLLASAAIAPGCGARPDHFPALTLVGLGLDAGEQLKHDALDDFTRTARIRVDLIPAWGTSEEQLTQISRLLNQLSNPPDVYVIDVIWPGTLGSHLLDLAPYAG